ncbi:MAG: DUF459 domain-containing protein [Actinobacteria bacterium]|nr:DUF459 domain-containing protein [Actinomycetota bacterium]
MAIDPKQRRRRPRRRVDEEGRRLNSAGSAVVIALLALLVGVLLNAPGLHKSAAIQPEGWKRDLALAVTEPTASVSDALLVDRPRRALKAVLGRSEDDEIDTGIAVPEPSPDETPATLPKPPPRQKFTPARPLRIWIAGDSLVVVPGQSILRAVGERRAIEPTGDVDGRIASGLERPDVFNWFEHASEVMRKERPRAVVLMFGGNDDHGFMTGLPEGREIGAFGSASWTAEYRRRVAGIMDTVTRRGAYLVWIGLPITADTEQTIRFDTINAIVQPEAAKRAGRVFYLDTYLFFEGDDGGYAQFVENDSGRLVQMRADDGVHFERAAGDLIARKVLAQLNRRFDLTSWRND